jgi:curved DNA-binding protein CbpA
MKSRPNYYRILQVQRDAPATVIRAGFRTMMQRLKQRPEPNRDDEKAALVKEAYAVLTDPEARAEYDASLKTRTTAKESSVVVSRASAHDLAAKAADKTQAGSRCTFCDAPCRGTALIEPGERCSRCDSPLYPAQQQLEAAGERAIERFVRRSTARYWTRWPKNAGRRGRIEDLSLSGMQLRTNEPLAPGEIVKIQSDVIDAIACVVYCRDLGASGRDRWRMGLMFVTLHLHRASGSFDSGAT